MWLESYMEDLLSHDVEQLEETSGRRRDTQGLRHYLEAYALSSAGVAEHKTIYDAAQVNKATADAYDELLAGLPITENVPAWTSNRLKRLVQSAQALPDRRGVIATALRPQTQRAGGDERRRSAGPHPHTFVAAQLRPELATSRTRPRLHHLRTEQGRHEIDLIAELAGQRVLGIEVKASAAPTRDDAKHLRWLHDELGERFLAGVVLHTGQRAYELDEKIIAAPIAVLWGLLDLRHPAPDGSTRLEASFQRVAASRRMALGGELAPSLAWS
jgi:predicted AAA+ superfamily ATPase